MKQSGKLHINIRTTLDRALDMISDNYKAHVATLDGMPNDAELKDVFHLERIQYNRQIAELQNVIKETNETSAKLLNNSNELEDENASLKKILDKERKANNVKLQNLKAAEWLKQQKLQEKILTDKGKQKSFKDDVLCELNVKDTLIQKLRARNAMLEQLMKKAVKIMANPLVMKDAFRRFNFDKYVYTMDKGGKDVEMLSDEALSDMGIDREDQDDHKDKEVTSEPTKGKNINKDLILVRQNSRGSEVEVGEIPTVFSQPPQSCTSSKFGGEPDPLQNAAE